MEKPPPDSPLLKLPKRYFFSALHAQAAHHMLLALALKLDEDICMTLSMQRLYLKCLLRMTEVMQKIPVQALDMLGGGSRGQYRINRAASWSGAASAGQRRPEAPAQPAQPAQGSRAAVSNSRLPQQRPRGLPAALPPSEIPKQPERAVQHRVSDPRAFHASDLAFQEPSHAGASKASSKRDARYVYETL